MGDSSTNVTQKSLSPNVIAALEGVRFIAQHIRDADKDNEVFFYVNKILYLILLKCIVILRLK